MDHDDDDDDRYEDELLMPLGEVFDRLRLGLLVIPEPQRRDTRLSFARSMDQQDENIMRAVQRKVLTRLDSVLASVRAMKERTGERVTLLKEMSAPKEDIDADVEILQGLSEDLAFIEETIADVEREP